MQPKNETEKKQYQTPTLIVYGDIRELTKGAGTFKNDAGRVVGKT